MEGGEHLMSVVSVNEYYDRGGSQDQTKTDFSRTFKVLVDDYRDGAAVIFAHPDIPSILSSYVCSGSESWSSSLLRTRTAKMLGGNDTDGFLWDVECKYSTKGEGEEQAGQENPILQPTQISIGTNRYQRAVDTDRTRTTEFPDGKRIANSAGTPFDPPLEVDDSRPYLVLTKNVAFFSLAWLEDYKDATNSDPYLGFVRYFWKVASISADRDYWDAPTGGRFYYWKVQLEIEGNDLLWHPVKILDRGRKHKGPGGTLLPIRVGTDRRPVQDPVLLDGAGNDNQDADFKGYWLEFDIYKRRSFGALGLL
jgi:hypothetical protein